MLSQIQNFRLPKSFNASSGPFSKKNLLKNPQKTYSNFKTWVCKSYHNRNFKIKFSKLRFRVLLTRINFRTVFDNNYSILQNKTFWPNSIIAFPFSYFHSQKIDVSHLCESFTPFYHTPFIPSLLYYLRSHSVNKRIRHVPLTTFYNVILVFIYLQFLRIDFKKSQQIFKF